MYTDANNAKEFLEQDTAVPPRGEAWDMRWTWTKACPNYPPRAIPQNHATPLIPSPKAAQSNGNNPEDGGKALPPRDATQRRQGRHFDDTEGDSTDPDHVENHWQYAALPSIFPKWA
jgi:hypothetical protein